MWALEFLSMFRRQELSEIYRRKKNTVQRTTVGEHSVRYTKVQNVPNTSEIYRRHMGDVLNMLL